MDYALDPASNIDDIRKGLEGMIDSRWLKLPFDSRYCLRREVLSTIVVENNLADDEGQVVSSAVLILLSRKRDYLTPLHLSHP